MPLWLFFFVLKLENAQKRPHVSQWCKQAYDRDYSKYSISVGNKTCDHRLSSTVPSLMYGPTLAQMENSVFLRRTLNSKTSLPLYPVRLVETTILDQTRTDTLCNQQLNLWSLTTGLFYVFMAPRAVHHVCSRSPSMRMHLIEIWILNNFWKGSEDDWNSPTPII